MGRALIQFSGSTAAPVAARAEAGGSWPTRRKVVGLAAALVLLLGFHGAARAADPYAAALDRKFESGNARGQTTDPKVAALEEALKAQVREMSERPELAPPDPPADEASSWLVLSGLILGAIGLGMIALLILRRWNRWLDEQAARREAAIAEDPLMVEFIRALHEELPLGAPGSLPANLHTAPATITTTAAKPAPDSSPAVDPFHDSRVLVAKKVVALRAEFQKIGRTTEQAEKLSILEEVLLQTESLKEAAAPNHLRSVRLIASGLHGLFNQLALRPSNLTPSVLRTAAAAIDLLELLCSRGSRPDLATVPPVRLLAVDDDAISRRAVALALKKAFSEPDLAPDGRTGLALASNQAYDLIFLDIEMPGMDGFELCSKIHETQLNRKTPVVFVTSHTDFESLTKSAWLGAQDLIGKPFMAFEITVKALTLVLRAREERELNEAEGNTEIRVQSGLHPEMKVEEEPIKSTRQASFDAPGTNRCAPLERVKITQDV